MWPTSSLSHFPFALTAVWFVALWYDTAVTFWEPYDDADDLGNFKPLIFLIFFNNAGSIPDKKAQF